MFCDSMSDISFPFSLHFLFYRFQKLEVISLVSSFKLFALAFEPNYVSEKAVLIYCLQDVTNPALENIMLVCYSYAVGHG
jgi:hypothetical protein